MRILFSFIVLLLISSCSTTEVVDLIVRNANIYTMDDENPNATYLVVKNEKIVAVGSDENDLEAYEAKEIIDADQKTLIPGIIDAHCHFYGLGLNQQRVDLVGTLSYEEIISKVQAFEQENPDMQFILGRGWDQNDWAVKDFPTKEKLDVLFPEKAVVLERVDGHAYLVNQKALDLANITVKTPSNGGAILKKNGKLTGVLVDNPMQRVDRIIPELSRAEQIQALKKAEDICFSYGLTTVNDAGLSRSTIELIDSLQQSGDLKIRVYAMVSNSPRDVNHFLDKGILKTDRLNVRSVKVYADGALGSRGAALKEEYSDQHNHFGAMVTPVAAIEQLAQRIADSEYQMNTHAIGDSANAVVLRAYQKVLKSDTDRRWKIEHAQVIDLDDIENFGTQILPSVQPTHATSDMYWAEDRLGSDRIEGAYAFKTLLEKSGVLPLGTDFPVEQVSPFLTFYAAVTRQDTAGYPEGGFMESEKLSPEQALKGMTLWPAFSNFEEEEKGSLEPGKWADFVILSKDILKAASDELPNIQAEKTFVAGVQVH